MRTDVFIHYGRDETPIDELVEQLAAAYRSGGKPAAEAKLREIEKHRPLKTFEFAVLQDKLRKLLGLTSRFKS